MEATQRSTLSQAALVLAIGLSLPLGIAAQNQPGRLAGPSSPAAAPNDPEFEAALVRENQLLARGPAVSIARLSEDGVPQVRMDFHFGGKVLPHDERALMELADHFTFESGKDEFSQAKDPSSAAVESWRNLILSSSEPVDSPPVATFFDPERDLLVVFRRLHVDLSCSGFISINSSFSGSTGQSFYWNFYADMTMAAVGPNLGSNTDPDLYLYYWTGSTYRLLSSSIASTTIDAVSALNTGCFSPLWRVRVYMFRGGSFSARGTGFNAN